MNKAKFNLHAHCILTFRKWGRKNYSAFQTMHRVVRISVLAVIYFLSTPSLSIATEKDTTEVKMQYDLDEIEVSAQRSPAMYSQVARIISVIESDEIEYAPARNIQDLLEYVAGVDVRQRGSEGVQADISIRGGTFDQMLILLNGINITDPQTGHHNLNLPVSLNQIERIEILEGPAARVYGPNAFSGAINIVTKMPASSLVSADATYGSFSYSDLNISGSVATGKLRHSISANRKSSDGYIENTDFKTSSVFYSNQLKTKSGTFSLQLGNSEKGFGANSFYTPKYPNQYEATKTLFSSAKWESNSKLHLTPVVYYRRHKDRFELFRDNPASWYTTHNYHLTNVYGANLNSWIQSDLGKTALGFEFRSENILSNVLGEELDAPKKVPGEDAEFTKSKTRNTLSAFFEHSFYLENWTLTGGIMTNHISESKLGWNAFPGVEISYNFTDKLKAFSSFNTSLRMPTFTDLYYEGPSNVGNPDLKPEKSATIEGGLKFNTAFVQGYAVLFYREGKNIIDWVKNSSDDVWQPQNLTQINSFGSEFQLRFNLQKLLGNAFPEQLEINYFTNNLTKENQELISNYVLDNLKHKLVIGLNQKIVRRISLNMKLIYQDREGTFTGFDNNDWANEIDYSPFWLLDGKISYTYKNLSLFVSASNIFNTDYYDIGNVIQPGRWIKTGVSYKIDFN
ncbi:TonB-dependent receptor [Maribellus comscasis]|uniref:TonB-dependent receptor n=1 Tax=Maribellus comscasis TaxID=2681766 RepID=A0A6I6JRG6_9BACT|nr:TonB-dependent receptor [Maribellus comscasis]QGY42752.1 TonB-dependent receptor [Maribellus comscasis]